MYTKIASNSAYSPYLISPSAHNFPAAFSISSPGSFAAFPGIVPQNSQTKAKSASVPLRDGLFGQLAVLDSGPTPRKNPPAAFLEPLNDASKNGHCLRATKKNNISADFVYFQDFAFSHKRELQKRAEPRKQRRKTEDLAGPVDSNGGSTDPGTDRAGVYCVCKGIDDGIRPMIQCDSCKNWFHFACIGMECVRRECCKNE